MVDFTWTDFFFTIGIFFVACLGVSMILPEAPSSIINVPHFIG